MAENRKSGAKRAAATQRAKQQLMQKGNNSEGHNMMEFVDHYYEGEIEKLPVMVSLGVCKHCGATRVCVN